MLAVHLDPDSPNDSLRRACSLSDLSFQASPSDKKKAESGKLIYCSVENFCHVTENKMRPGFNISHHCLSNRDAFCAAFFCLLVLVVFLGLCWSKPIQVVELQLVYFVSR